MSLSPDERAAGRAWREARQNFLGKLNVDSPPDLLVNPHIRHFRHECSARGGRSVSFELKERYELCPQLGVLEAGRLAWIWKEGKCHCGLTARSRTGYVADARERRPIGRM